VQADLFASQKQGVCCMMTGRERVIAALEFQNPDRPPRDLWALPYISLFREDELNALLEKYPMDIGASQRSPGRANEQADLTARVGTYVDEWGSVWAVGEPGVIGEVKQPALEDWSALAAYQPPWEEIRDRDFSQLNEDCDNSDLFMLSNVTARPFERLQFLRGTENAFIDIAYDSAEMRKLLEMIHEYYLEDIKGWCETNVDAIFMMDDWGTNNALLISPDAWRALFKPLYKDYCDMIHAAGKYCFFHTDGHTEAIYGDLIEVGMDALNSQLFTMDIEKLAAQYKGKVTFWGELDRQHVLPFGTPDEVHEAVMRVRSALDDGSGGVIAQCEWGKDNSTENVDMVFKSWAEPLG
jgi:uroporphyrinogen decarboxylase